ncbi:MAG: ABC transporter substrate-binding protein [bacterium]|nr:ABC transporter substrate-binding protein [bacterium]
MKKLIHYFWPLLLLALILSCQRGTTEEDVDLGRQGDDVSLERVKKAGVLLWGADVIGGVPYVYEDPNKPGTYIGFEMDIARSIARHLGVKQRLVIKAWDTLIPELQKGSFDMAMNGIEDTEDRRRLVLFSEPYFVYSQQITVKKETEGISTLEDLRGKKVATLSGTAAEDLLRKEPTIEVSINPEIIYSYRDLEEGMVDAVLLDKPIAVAYGATNPKLKNVGESFGEGTYVIAVRLEDRALLEAINAALKSMKESGELARILQRWGIMDEHQKRIGIVIK